MSKVQVVDRKGRVLRAFQAGETLADGEFIRVPMVGLRDSATFDAKGEPVRALDAAPLASHRPGFRATDSAARDFAHGAYVAQKHLVANAWRDARQAAPGPKSTASAELLSRAKRDLANAWRGIDARQEAPGPEPVAPDEAMARRKRDLSNAWRTRSKPVEAGHWQGHSGGKTPQTEDSAAH